MPACRDRLGRDESVRLADKDAYLPKGTIVGDLACAAMHKAKRAPRFPAEPSWGAKPLSFCYYGAPEANENGQGEGCTKFLLLFPSSNAFFSVS